jgi:hypothetical protein
MSCVDISDAMSILLVLRFVSFSYSNQLLIMIFILTICLVYLFVDVSC